MHCSSRTNRSAARSAFDDVPPCAAREKCGGDGDDQNGEDVLHGDRAEQAPPLSRCQIMRMPIWYVMSAPT